MLISVLQGDWFLAGQYNWILFAFMMQASLVISISSHYTLAVKLMPDPVIFTVL